MALGGWLELASRAGGRAQRGQLVRRTTAIAIRLLAAPALLTRGVICRRRVRHAAVVMMRATIIGFGCGGCRRECRSIQ